VFLAAAQQQQMIENVKKCKNFLSTLIKLAASQPEATVSNVRDLIQGLIVSTYDIVNFFFCGGEIFALFVHWRLND